MLGQIMRAICIIAFVVSLNGCGIFGPGNDPHFNEKQWKSLKITYYVIEKLGGSRTKRTFQCEKQDVIDSLRKNMNIKLVKPNSLGKNDDSVIAMSDGEIWDVDFVFEDRFDVCKRIDNYYSYIYELSDRKFFDGVRQLCLENEKLFSPKAVMENILLRTNLVDSEYKVLEK
jgi:hypothetical protein